MKALFTRTVLVCLLVFTRLSVFSQSVEDFNSRPGTPLSNLKNHLQGKCWQFPGFNLNENNGAHGIEGDGAMVSENGTATVLGSGIYTPVLDVNGTIQLSFTYKIDAEITGPQELRVYLTAPDNQIIELLDKVELRLKSANAVYTYHNTFNPASDKYKLFINYKHEGLNTGVTIDQLSTGANQLYANGCNQAPVAVPDQFTGTKNHTASGNILTNDADPNNELLSPFITESPDGTVSLLPTGEFTFTPNKDFNGSTATFTYVVCDNGANQMCSVETPVNLNFAQAGLLPVSLINFVASFDDRSVILNWTTTFENNNAYFELERSLDGVTYETEAKVKGQGTTGITHVYAHTDRTPERITSNKDLYYRLKQVDLDGTTTTSKVLVVRVYKTKSLQMISVTPNPVKNDIRVNVQLNENSFIVMKVANSNGNEIIRKSAKCVSGENMFSLEGTSRLASGLYFLEVMINSNERMTLKLVKD